MKSRRRPLPQASADNKRFSRLLGQGAKLEWRVAETDPRGAWNGVRETVIRSNMLQRGRSKFPVNDKYGREVLA
jgi:hypothetical protein